MSPSGTNDDLHAHPSYFNLDVRASILRNINQLVINTIDMRNITAVGRWNKIFKFFPIEDINPNEVTLSMTMLEDLGGGNFHNLARARLNDNVPVLADRASLLRIGLGGSGVALGLKVMLLVRHDSLDRGLG